MNNKPQMMNERNQIKTLDWKDEQEDDFLLGKTPNEFQSIWEDEE